MLDKKNMTKKLKQSLIFLIIINITYLTLRKIIDTDLFFDIRSAEDLLKYGLDFKDHMSWVPNLTYLYHHYLYDLIIYPIFKYTGFQGLLLLMYILFTITITLIYRGIKDKTNNTILALISCGFISYFAGFSFFPRVQSFSYPIIVLIYLLVDKLYETGKKKYSIMLVLLSIFLVNLHMPIWMVSIIMWLPKLAEVVIQLIAKKVPAILKIFNDKVYCDDTKYKKEFLITFGLFVLGALLSPYGILPYTFQFKVALLQGDYYSFIGEMERAGLFQDREQIIFFILMLIPFFINVKIKFSDFLYLFGLAIFSYLALRNQIFQFFIYGIIIPKLLYEWMNNKPKKNKIKDKFIEIYKRSRLHYFILRVKKLDKKLKVSIIDKINSNVIIVLLDVMLIVFFAESVLALDIVHFDYGISTGEPLGAAAYIKNNIDYENKKIFNDFDTGSFLAFEDIPVFIDTRAEVYIPAFGGGPDIFRDVFTLDKYTDCVRIINKYKFDYFLVSRGDTMEGYLRGSDKYELGYEDGYYYVYVTKEEDE